MRRFSIVAMFCLVAVVVSSASMAQRPILFSASQGMAENAPCHLYVVNPDGTGLGRITEMAMPSPIRRPSQPDNQVLLQLSKAQDYQTVVMNLEGRILQRFSAFTDAQLPSIEVGSWCPDGRSVCTVQGNPETHTYDIVNINVANGERREIIKTPAEIVVSNPVWAPDGQTLAFTFLEYNKGNTDYLLKNNVVVCDTTGAQLPLRFEGFAAGKTEQGPFRLVGQPKLMIVTIRNFLQWSADSGRLCYFTPSTPSFFGEDSDLAREMDPAALHCFDLRLGRLVSQKVKDGYIISACLSPDGTKFAFCTISGLWMWEVGHGEPKMLIDVIRERLGEDLQPPPGMPPLPTIPKYWGPIDNVSWKFDGSQIIFHTSCQLFTADPATGKSTEVLSDPDLNIWYVVW